MTKTDTFEECFFASPERFEQENLTISGAEARHIAVVLRHRVGDVINVLDGCGRRFNVELTECSPVVIRGRVRGKEEFSRATPEVWLASGIIRATRMDLLMEKCAELGVHTVVPVSTTRSLPSRGVSASRLARWQRISACAMTQSARLFLPEVLKPLSLEELLETAGQDATVVLAHFSGKSMHLLEENDLSRDRVVGCVGPEGDFTPDELEFLVRHDAIPVSLGQGRLRTETAAMVLVDRLNFILEKRRPVRTTASQH